MGLPKRYEALARLGAASTTGDPEGEITAPGAYRRPAPFPTGEVLQRPPVLLGRQGGRGARLPPGPPGRKFEVPERTVTLDFPRALARSARGTPRAGYAIECVSDHVCSLIADLGDAYCLELRRTPIGRSTSRMPWPPPAANRGQTAPGGAGGPLALAGEPESLGFPDRSHQALTP